MGYGGIVCLPTRLANEPILSSRLQFVLPHHSLSSIPLNAAYALASRNALKLRLFIDHIRAASMGFHLGPRP